MKTKTTPEKILPLAGLLLLSIGFGSCSDDDDVPEPLIQQILVEDHQNLTGNTLRVQKIVVNQDSFLTAVKVDDENSDEFIAAPILLTAGTHRNVDLTFFEKTIKNAGGGQKIILKLYADNKQGGTQGVWDSTDAPVLNLIHGLLKKTVTVHSEYDPFSYFDNNNDDILDFSEASLTYPNNFYGIWDTDGDNFLDLEEFYYTTFINTDVNIDLSISREEWDEGFISMFTNWTEDNFSSFDENENDFLSDVEWNNIFVESLWFETYDTDDDERVSEDEFNLGLLNDWDLNNDLQIDEEEFNNYWLHVSNWVEFYEW